MEKQITLTHKNRDITDLTREELITRVQTLQQRLDELTTPPPNDWHSWFYSLLNIVLHKYKSVVLDREVVLGSQPPRADFVVIMKDEDVDLELEIFRHFRKINILEFKNPDDTLNEYVLWKTIGYAGFYIFLHNIPAEDITITLFRGAKPVKLLKTLVDYIEADEIPGIYHIKNWRMNIPIQIVITTELKGAEYAGFRTISRKPRIEDIQQMIQEVKAETDPDMIGFYRDYLNLLSKLDREVIKEAKRRNSDMEVTWWDIFKPELEERDRINLYGFVQNGTMSIENAAMNAGIPVDQFIREMEEYEQSRKMQMV